MKNLLCVPYKGCNIFDVTQCFGVKQSFGGVHMGVDFAFPNCYGKFLVAPEKCTVEKIITDDTFDNDYYPKFERGYGIVLIPFSDSSIQYIYWHCLQVFPVNVGQVVEQGDIVAQIGNSGMCFSGGVYVPLQDRSSGKGSHLHYEMRIDGSCENVLTNIDFAIQPKITPIKAVSQIITKMANMVLNRK
jgi:murein DD-endopeptidase MepM/ murein hydrolase activator NlpD